MSYQDMFFRQKDLINADKMQVSVTIVGCGGIGSLTALCLARMGMTKLTLIDFDSVDIMNMNNQGFDLADVGKNKAECVADKIKRAVDFNCNVVKSAYRGEMLMGIVISAVDNMATRKLMFENSSYAQLFINPAMGAEYASINVYEPNRNGQADTIAFNKAWYSDSEASPENCTSKSTIYTTSLIAGLIAKVIKDYLNGGEYTKSIEYDIKNNTMECYSNSGKHLTTGG